MDTTWMKVVNFSGEDIDPVVSVDNQGWSTSGEDLKTRKFQGRRANVPKPLFFDQTSVFEESNFELRVTRNSFQPAFDCGLGCFGNPTKLVETGKEELVNLYWVDFNEIRTAKELFDGRQVWKGVDNWIHFVRLTQRYKEAKTEEELIKFHQPEQPTKKEAEQPLARPQTREGKDFLTELDNMESAQPEAGSEARKSPKPVEQEVAQPRWQLRGFRDWIEEADFIESHANMPSGTRYYNP
ncbi:hypothetical protein F5Y13DRAFT_192372 [Hypoxylon sp. FL1857]|nr:hypothetical protein F5Y13DRAFT_192372 [Hypoxylon sp. FL1857]